MLCTDMTKEGARLRKGEFYIDAGFGSKGHGWSQRFVILLEKKSLNVFCWTKLIYSFSLLNGI